MFVMIDFIMVTWLLSLSIVYVHLVICATKVEHINDMIVFQLLVLFCVAVVAPHVPISFLHALFSGKGMGLGKASERFSDSIP